MSALKPCPHCGAKSQVWIGEYDGDGKATHYAGCDECDARTSDRYSREDAIAAWNRRTAPEIPEIDVEALGRAIWSAVNYLHTADSYRAADAAIAEFQRQTGGGT